MYIQEYFNNSNFVAAQQHGILVFWNEFGKFGKFSKSC